MKHDFRLLGLLVMAACGVAHANSVTSLVNAAGASWHDTNTWVGQVVPTTGDDVVVAATNGVALTNSTDFLNSITVKTNATLNFRNWTTLLSASNVMVNGTITHTAATTNGAPTNRVYILCTNLTVAGVIDADGKGYQGGRSNVGITVGQGPGGGQAGGDPSGAGGYGGEGSCKVTGGKSGTNGQTYGTTYYPVGPGSGSGYRPANIQGASGGGSIWIEAAGTVAVSGVIRANAGATPGSSHVGGGSGGAIFLSAGVLSGAGRVDARGGVGDYYGGGGGGGRIHVNMGLGFELAHSVVAGMSGGQITGWPEGYNGTYVVTTENPDLTVRGSPANHGTPTPYAHGVSAILADTWVTNSVNSPADTANGVRYFCLGWTLTTNGALADSAATTQAVFQLVSTNTVLTYLWTNQYELVVSPATNGTAMTASNGWYTRGAIVTGLMPSPDPDYEFLLWSGDLTTALYTNTPLDVVMDRRRYITAHFGSTVTATNRSLAGGNWFAWTNWVPKGIPGRLDTARLTGSNTTLNLPVTVGALVVGATATNTFTGWDTLLQASEVTVSGLVTHTACTTGGAATNRVWIMTGNLNVPGAIDVSGKGYQGGTTNAGRTAGQGLGGGQANDPSGAGGYGGEGSCKLAGGKSGTNGQTYGSATQPIGPGSGSGLEPGQKAYGAAGGGSVWIEASGRITIGGTIRANGGMNVYGQHVGGGSGGAIYLYAAEFGGSGVLEAKGGGGAWNAGGGGGGRIAVSFASGSELTYSVEGGAKGTATPPVWPAGSNGTYIATLLGQALFVQGSPVDHDTPTPYPHGASSVMPGIWITNSVVSPADETNGVRYVCTGWVVTTNGAVAESGASSQAIFHMHADVTNTVLTYLWTNAYQLVVSGATNGSATTASNGWHLSGTIVPGIQEIPDPGYEFAQWWGDVPGDLAYSNTITLTMDRPRAVTAHFIDPLNGTNRTRSTGGKWFDWQSWSPMGVPGPKDSVVLSGGSTLLDYPITLVSLTITNATLSFTNWNTTLTLTGDLAILTNGTVTHVGCYRFPSDMSNRVCITARSITIDGSINVNAKGYYRGRYPDWGPSTNGQGPGRGLYFGSNSGTGGGHGGAGGRCDGSVSGGVTYGSATNPVGPGSGGAYGASHRPEGGGNGGGSVQLEASDTLTLNGIIVANGGDADLDWGGGGSGGAIWITCRRFHGPAGTHLTAKGGITASGGGGGGGGRIAIAYSGSFQYQGTNTVAGGINTAYGAAYNGGAGTYVQVDNSIKGSSFMFR
jgi:hypothetical protein